MTPSEARQLSLALMRRHGLLEAGWTFQWSRGKRQLGCAQVKRQRDSRTGKIVETRTIKLSHHLVALNDDAEVRETILHEIAHALAGVENGHNHVWRAACRRVGAKPQRLASETVHTVEPRYALTCGRCQRALGKRYRRMSAARLKRLYCMHCGRTSLGQVRLHDMTPSPEPE